MAERDTVTFRVNREVDNWLDDFTEGESYNRSDVMNRAIKVYASKLASGEWVDPKFKDKIDQRFSEMSDK